MTYRLVRVVFFISMLAMLDGCGWMGGGTPTPNPFVPSAVPGQVTPQTVSPSQPGSGVLWRVRQRGKLACGVNPDLPGFSTPDPANPALYTGFDADFCRVVAVAIFGDPSLVVFVPISSPPDGLKALVDGTIDVMFRNTTWTAARDTGITLDGDPLLRRLDFGPTTFHDGQSFMVRKVLGITTVGQLDQRNICVQRDTTSEQNLLDLIHVKGMNIEPLRFATAAETYSAYDAGQCDAVTGDVSSLNGQRTTLQNPSEHMILDERISREALGPVFVENDSQWRDVVSWSVFATIYAEELGVESSNVETLYQSTTSPPVRLLLGLEGTFGQNLGLANDFAYQIIRQMGNYGQIYTRHLGPNTPTYLDRGPNKTWKEFGVLYSPPFR